jgi:predicted ATPase with chaperone activity
MQPGEPSSVIRERVIRTRQMQEERFKPFKGIYANAQMTERMLHQFAEPDDASLDMLRMADGKTRKSMAKTFFFEKDALFFVVSRIITTFALKLKNNN